MKPPAKQSPAARAEAWEALEKYAARAELERIDALTPEQVDAELRALGVDPKKAGEEPPVVSGEHVIEVPPPVASGPDIGFVVDAAPTSGGVVKQLPTRRSRLASVEFVYLAAAAVLAVLCGHYLHLFEEPNVAKPKPTPDEVEPAPTPAPSAAPAPVGPAPSDPKTEAARLRAEAKDYAAKGAWGVCWPTLMDANKLDPEGETAEWKALRVKAEKMYRLEEGKGAK